MLTLSLCLIRSQQQCHLEQAAHKIYLTSQNSRQKGTRRLILGGAGCIEKRETWYMWGRVHETRSIPYFTWNIRNIYVTIKCNHSSNLHKSTETSFYNDNKSCKGMGKKSYLCSVATKFLSKGQRCCILSVCTTNFHNIFEFNWLEKNMKQTKW